MANTLTTMQRQASDGPTDHSARLRDSTRVWRVVAMVAGLVGALLAVATPLLPVEQDRAELSWPQAAATGGVTGAVMGGVTAPLVSYSPLRIDAAIPCSAVDRLAARGGVLVSTVPRSSVDAEHYGLVAKVSPAGAAGRAQVQILLRNQLLASSSITDLPRGCRISVATDATRTTTDLGRGATVLDGDHRPQLVGLFSDLTGPAPTGLLVHAELDSRFTTTPSTVKLIAIVGAVSAALLALIALYRLDRADGRRSRRVLPRRWWSFGLADGVVVGTLVLWHFIGATTSDDGYQFTMARTADHAGYLANYFRYWGVPETPVGVPYYTLFGRLAEISPASTLVRLPALLAGIVCWLVISREVLPRLGAAARRDRLALWTGGLVFLAFWLPYNNGLRPEPAVAVGVLLTWCSVERAIATRRLLPLAVALLIATGTVTAGPSGIICLAALLAGIRPLVLIIARRVRADGYLATLAPLAVAGTVVLTVMFATQRLAEVFEMRHAHTVSGPDSPWFEEYQRYQWLLNPVGADGSLARRFGVIAMYLCVGVVIAAMLRKGGRIPGLASGPARRVVGVTIGSAVLMMFNPTKWTHHFGVYAGLAGVLAATASVAVASRSLRSDRNRALFAAAVLGVLTISFATMNAWWYVSTYHIPWVDKPVSVHGLEAGTVLLAATGVMLVVAAICHAREPFRTDRTPSRWAAVPALTVAAAIMVVFQVLSFTKAAISQYPAFSLAQSNFATLAGKPCGFADDVLVETDPNAGMLAPVSGQVGAALGAGGNNGFTPNGVAADLTADKQSGATVGNADPTDDKNPNKHADLSATSGAGRIPPGANGSEVALPFGLDPTTTPVLGSFGATDAGTKTLVSGWYRLPAADAHGYRGDIVSITAAGRIRSLDLDGIATGGQRVELEYGASRPGGAQVEGRVVPDDIGPAPAWRNLRVPLAALPAAADVIRITASVTGQDPTQWVAVTPPRVPRLQTLDAVVGRRVPALVDWNVGLQFPCQRPFDHRVGVAELPQYRIMPDHAAVVAMTNDWEGHFNGGPLGWIQLLTRSEIMPSYLRDDWKRDWGQLERLVPLDPAATPARLDESTVQRSGLWTPGPINTGLRA